MEQVRNFGDIAPPDNVITSIIKNILPYYFVKNYRKILHVKETVFDRWLRDKGDEVLRLEYEGLDASSIVFDIGGYKGQWASDIFSKYCSRVFIFEPVKVFSDKIQKRFSKNNKINCFPFGLGKGNKIINMSIDADASSFFLEGKDKQQCELIDIIDFIQSKEIAKIDLMKINIEGGEYDLLDRLIETDFIQKIKNLQIQFHNFMQKSPERREKIRNELRKTHKISWCYDWIWENWEII